jgi:hypothetical protein
MVMGLMVEVLEAQVDQAVAVVVKMEVALEVVALLDKVVMEARDLAQMLEAEAVHRRRVIQEVNVLEEMAQHLL